MSLESSKALNKIYTEHIKLFRDNLSHMGYSLYLITNKRSWEDPELFTGKEVL